MSFKIYTGMWYDMIGRHILDYTFDEDLSMLYRKLGLPAEEEYINYIQMKLDNGGAEEILNYKGCNVKLFVVELPNYTKFFRSLKDLMKVLERIKSKNKKMYIIHTCVGYVLLFQKIDQTFDTISTIQDIDDEHLQYALPNVEVPFFGGLYDY